MAFYSTRTVAYSATRVAGDISAVTGSQSQNFRGAMLGVAKTLGDANVLVKKGNVAQSGNVDVGSRFTSRLSGLAARKGGFSNLNSLPPVARRLIQRSVGSEMQKIRSHGFGTSLSSGGGKATEKSIMATLNQLNLVYVEINRVDQKALLGAFTSPKVVELMENVGKEILNDIIANAPGTTYKNSFTITTGVVSGNVPVVSIVTNDFHKGKWIEYGTIKMQARPIIRNAFRKSAGMPLLPSAPKQ